ncbi:MAG: flippase [Eggerthellaceae bacterium]|nr:flippase [Eggerthellaceae bacterium]
MPTKGKNGNRKRSIKKNFAFQASYQVLLILVPLITTPYLSRTLGASGVGVFSYTQAITHYFFMFAILGMSTYGVREIAAAGEDRMMRSRTFWSAYLAQLCAGIIVSIAYCMYMTLMQPAGGFRVALVWSMWILAALLDVSWLLFGVEEFKIPTIRSMATKIASVIIIFVFVRSPEDLWIYCAAIAGSLLANQVLIWPFVRRYVDWVRVHWLDVRRHFKPNLLLFVPVVAISLYTSMDKILLGSIAGMEQAGYFEYSEKLSKVPLAAITAMGTVMLPRMTAELSHGQHKQALELLENSIWVMLAMAFAFAFGIAAISPEFALVFLGDEFAECDVLMAVLAIVIPLISVTNVVGRQYLIPTKRDKLYTASVCVGAAINVIVNLILIPQFGALGASVATVASELGVLMTQAWFVRKELPFARYAKGAIPFVAIGLIMAICVRVIAHWLNGMWNPSPLGLFIEITVGAVVFVALSIVWCVFSNNSQFKTIINQ